MFRRQPVFYGNHDMCSCLSHSGADTIIILHTLSYPASAMEEQQNASKQIFQSLSNMKDQSSEVSEKASDMMNGISNVTKDMNSVSQISATILGSMDEMSVGMQQISEASQNVSSLAETTKKNISIMNEKLGQFKI